MTKMKSLTTIFICLALASCVNVSKSGYYWGTYSQTYYQLLKDPTEKNIEAHKSSLHEIIKISKERQLRVAPGINAELAFMLSKDNEGIPESLYAQELKLYTESKIFIERLNNKKK